MMRRGLVLWIGILLGACGGTAIVDDHVAGAGGAGAGSGAGAASGAGANSSVGVTTTSGVGGSVPPECAATAEGPGPYPVTVEFVNTSMKTYFLEVGCELRYDVTACATAYSEPLVRNGFCAAPCDGPPDCIVCARCPFGAAEVAPGAIVAEGWGGQTFTFGMNGADCQCHIAHVAPAAKYRVVVPVFDSSEAVSNRGMPTHFAQTDFTLPAAGGVVTVDIGSVVGP